MLRESKQEKLSSFVLAVKPMKAFTHGFTDSVSPDNGSNSPFFVNGECESYLSFGHKEIQISLGVSSFLWQPGQSSMGVSMTCYWSTGTLWHWVTHIASHFYTIHI